MSDTSFLGLVQNAALLLATAFIFDLVASRRRTGQSLLHQLAIGLALGVIGITVILTPWTFTPGIVFDTRSVLLGIAGLFFGPFPATITMVMTAAFRYYLGGAGAWTGVGVILTSGVIGMAWRHYRRGFLAGISWRELYLFGMVIHLAMLAMMLTLPWETAMQVIANIALPVLLIYPPGTALLGALMVNRLRRERIESALVINDQILKDTQSISRVGGWEHDIAKKRTTWTDEVYCIYGVDKNHDPDDIGKAISFYAEGDRQILEQSFLNAVHKGESYDLELQFNAADGTPKWVRTIGKPVVKDDKIIKVFGNIIDITDRKQAEGKIRELLAAVQKEKNTLSALFDAMTDEVWFADTQKRFIMANPAALKQFCLDPDQIMEVEALAKSLVVLRPDGSARPVEEAPPLSALAGKVVLGQEELIQTPANGEFRYRQVNAAPVRDSAGQIIGAVSVVRDITDRKQADTRLAALSSRQEALLAAIPDIVMEVDQNKIYTWANQAGLDFFGDDVVGRETDYYFEGQQDPYDTVQPLFKDNENVIYLESWQRRKDGQKRLLAWRCRVLKDEKGEARGALSSANDITQAKQVEEEIRKLNDDLEQRVHQRTTLLETTNKELESFSYSVSHDLRAPLRSIDGFSHALMEDYEGRPLDDTAKAYLAKIRKATHHMGHLIDDLLKLSRIARTEFRTEPVDLSRMVQALADKRRQDNPDRVPEVVVQEGVTGQCDHNLMEIVIGNLLDNAWKFTEKVSLPRIEFGTIRKAGKTACFFKDNGVGFDMAYASKLFGPFQRLHSQEEFPGTGIGLATVKRIITRHGGQVWAEGEVDKGATFYFTLS